MGKKYLLFTPLLFCLYLILPLRTGAQNSFASEKELKKEAEQLFKKADFATAYNLFSQLLSLYPKDPNYNFKFGVCMLMAGEDKEKPIEFLEFASKKEDVDPEVFFYLGKAYHMNYRFDNAISAYHSFEKVTSKTQLEKFQVDRQIEMCNNGKNLLNSISDLYILEKKELKESEYFRSYDLSEIGGKVLVKLDDFKTEIDKKKKENSVMYLSSQSIQISYSSYGEDGINGKDIFIVNKLDSGRWGAPLNIGQTINTPYDEDFPFLTPDGKELYFCSNGHNSMGGYDIFKSTFNHATNTWGTPVNMDFPINTPGDDILYITDNKTAYFSSNRSSANGSIAVYKIGVERKPAEITMVQGKVLKDGAAVKDAKITVKNVENGDLVGIYNTTADGDYFFNLPNGGKYLYTIESNDTKPQSDVVIIAGQRELAHVTQEINLDDEDKITIKSTSDKGKGDSNYLLALSFIREKAKMEVNYKEAALLETSKEEKTDSSVAEETASSIMSNDDIVKIAYEDAREVEKEAQEQKKQAEQAVSFATLKKGQAQAKYEEEKSMRDLLSTITDEGQKQETKQRADELHVEYEKLSKESVTAFNFAKKLQKDAAAKEEEASLSHKYAKDLEIAVNSGNSAEAIASLNVQKEKLESISLQRNNTNNAYASIKIDADNKQKEVEDAVKKSETLTREIDNIDKEIKNLQEDAQKTKNDQLKQAILDQIKDLEEDKIFRGKEIVDNGVRIKKLEEEAEGLRNEAQIVNDIMGQSQPTTTEGDVLTSGPQNQKGDEQKNEDITISQNTSSETYPPSTDKTNENELSNEATISSLEIKYNEELEKVSTLDNNYEREVAVSNSYKNWAEEINKEIVAHKEELEKTTDASSKEVISRKIQNLENEAADKNILAEKSLSKANEIKQNEQITADSNTAPLDTVTSRNNAIEAQMSISENSSYSHAKQFEEPLANTEKLNSELERQQAKAEIYKNWSLALNQQLADKKQELAQAENDSQKTALTQEITNLEQEVKNKEELRQQSITISEKLTQNPSVSNLTSDTTSSTSLAANATMPAENIENTQDANVTNSNSQTTGPKINIELQKEQSISLRQESESLKDEASAAKTKAYATEDPVERDQQLENAVKLENQAMQKQLDASSVTSQINKIEYDSNQVHLNELIEISSTSTENEVALAGMIVDEAKFYFTEAATLREKAKTTDSYLSRKNIIQQADSTERLAIQKQQKAAEIFIKYKSQYKSDQPSGSLTTANTTPTDTNQLSLENKSIPAETPLANTPIANGEEVVPVDTTKQEENKAIAGNVSVEENPGMTEAQRKDSSMASAVIPSNDQSILQNLSGNDAISFPPLEETKLQEVKETPEFKSFIVLNSEADIAKREAEAAQKTSTAFKIKGEDFQQQAKEQLTSADTISSEVERDQARQKAIEYSNLAAENFSKADSATRLAENSEATAVAKQQEADLFLQSLDKNMYENVISAANQSGIKYQAPALKSDQRKDSTDQLISVNNEPVIEKININAEGIDIPVIASEVIPSTIIAANVSEKFERNNTPVYSTEKPIPINEKLPDGLIFKVQIGAFRNPIPQDLFKGMAPISGETTPKGLIRYTAGLFTKFENANKIKEEIKSLGYRDAFVVAFLNGKRVALSQVLNTPASAEIFNASNVSQPNAEKEQVTVSSVAGNNQITEVSPQNLAQINGLLYTVQVGVFSRPVTSMQLFNIKPLYNEITTSGLIKYTTGIFNSIDKANEAKNRIVNIGIKDAFVSAYNNGKRIPVDEALKLESTKPDVFAEETSSNVSSVVISEPVNQQEASSAAISGTDNASDNSEISYSVQIGAFKNEIPVNIANLYIKIGSKFGNINTISENGMTIFTIGSLKNKVDADNLKEQIILDGITDAFVVMFKNGIRITSGF